MKNNETKKFVVVTMAYRHFEPGCPFRLLTFRFVNKKKVFASSAESFSLIHRIGSESLQYSGSERTTLIFTSDPWILLGKLVVKGPELFSFTINMPFLHASQFVAYEPLWYFTGESGSLWGNGLDRIWTPVMPCENDTIQIQLNISHGCQTKTPIHRRSRQPPKGVPVPSKK